MTPPPRWVLLAFLLAVAVAHPVEDACVRLCRARDTSPEFTGGCHHQQKRVLQSSGGRFPIQHLFRLCLTPCHGAATLDSPMFDGTELCRTFRDTLIERQRCSCDDLPDDGVRSLEQPRSRVKDIEEDQLKRNMLGEPEKELAVAPADLPHQSESKNEYHPEHIMKIVRVKESKKTIQSVLEEVPNLTTGLPINDPWPTTSIDWVSWCLIQCNNGTGGNACNCDILP
ncbi:uncharacterized protein LOC143423214 [Xylocopa sonorina]|uniref:uncharacterized protein LOC143423214 n=1 Tax=Xylocopa sonorina TaxID=1818115 RepID=UPI00403B291C